MRTCPSCGGVPGDCFNPEECAWIGEQQERQSQHDLEQRVTALEAAPSQLDILTQANESLMNRTPLKRKTPMRRAGKKTKAWATTRAKLKVRFEAASITRCEECRGTFALSWAHRFKRRFITTQQELETVALLCQRCHSLAEALSHEDMYCRITAIIAARETPVQTCY